MSSKKSPAVLWYPADYLVGIIGMTWEEQGRYVYLLNVQFEKGHIDISRIMPDCPEIVLAHFVQDEDGLYYNERMEEEQNKRQKYCDSRSKNRKKSAPKEDISVPCESTYEATYEDTYEQTHESHMSQHMGNVNVNVNENINNNNINNNNARAREDLFEYLWSIYPNKKGKGQVSDKAKRRLLEIGSDEMERAIQRYKDELAKDDWRKPQYGSTFFNSGYVDYLDANFVPGERASPKSTGNQFLDLLTEGSP